MHINVSFQSSYSLNNHASGLNKVRNSNTFNNYDQRNCFQNKQKWNPYTKYEVEAQLEIYII